MKVPKNSAMNSLMVSFLMMIRGPSFSRMLKVVIFNFFIRLQRNLFTNFLLSPMIKSQLECCNSETFATLFIFLIQQ